MPAGLGKTVRVMVFAQGEAARNAAYARALRALAGAITGWIYNIVAGMMGGLRVNLE